MKQRRTQRWMVHGGLVGTLIAAGAAGLGGCGDDGGDDGPPPVTVVTGAGAGDVGGQGGGGVGGGGGEGGQDAGPILAKSSKSSTIAISDDDAYVVTANADDGSISIFTAADDTRVAKLDVGEEPSAVVIHPDGVTAYVANRADATVVEVTDLRGSPAVGSPVAVGSEPTGLALSPSGRTLFVAEWAEGRISVIDTATMAVTGTIDGPEHPRGIAVTNDGDEEDADEVLVVPEFYGEAQPGGEVQDDGRAGKIRTYSVADNSPQGPIALAPRDSGFSVLTSPNQLFAVAIAGDKLYVPSVSASPEPPVQFNQNVQPVLYVARLSERAEDTSNVGTTNLAQLVRDDIAEGDPRQFLADIVDVALVGDIAYVLSRGTNVVQRVTFNEATGVAIGSAFNDQIDVGPAPAGAPAGCLVPDGIATSHASKRAYVNCRASRRLGVIDLELQEQITTVETSNPPATPTEIAENRGFRFFHTARARWSAGGWSDCASCHPDGLTDNITWAFAAGPRQSTSLDGSFSKGAGPQEQRVFNWTGIFDEIHDFERNTRGVSGGLGAVTQSDSCGTLSEETPSALPGPPNGLLGTPVKEIQDTQADNCTTDWDDIEAWVRTIRPPKALQSVAAADVAAGAQLFLDGGCDSCHSGAGFTVSRRFFEPSTATNTSLLETAFPASAFPAGFPAAWNEHTTEIGLEPGTGAAPLQVACAIRNIGTFGVPGDPTATDALELRANGAGAQGSKGYNVPSLYGLAVGAPFFHHGQAPTLRDALADPKWTAHLQAGNAVFVPSDEQLDQLVAYLLTIDAAAEEVATPAGFDVCRASF